jgi:two-component system NarL family sensor kinase
VDDLAPAPRHGPAVRTPAAVIRTAGLLGALSGAAALALAAWRGELTALLTTPESVVAPSFGVVAWLLAGHRRAQRMALLLAVVAVFAGVYAAASALTTAWADAARAPAGVQEAVGWVTLWSWVPALGLIVTVLPHLVPEGRPMPGWWRRLPLVGAVVVAAGTLLAAVAPRATTMNPSLDNPLGVEALRHVVPAMGLAVVGAAVVLSLLGFVSLVLRFRRSSGVVRRQLAWFGYGLAGTVIATAVAPSEVRALAVLLLPAGLMVAALRFRLYEIDRLLNRTAVGTVLLAGAAVTYAAVAGWAAVLLGERSPVASFIGAFAVAIAFHPARVRVQRVVDRVIAPQRIDPDDLTRDLDRVLRAAGTPRAGLAAGVDLLRTRIHARGIAVEAFRVSPVGHGADAGVDRDPVVVAQSGAVDDASAVLVNLWQHGAVVGRLRLIGGDAESEHLVRRPALQRAMAGPLATAMHAWWLSLELEESRHSIVSTREEERRRLRRDLHDGLGPQLAAITMALETARHALHRERTDTVATMLDTGIEQSRSAVDDIRVLVAGLRPPALDELGLEGALRSTGPGLLADHEAATRITISGGSDLGPLGAATEVAAYRIAQEAITNAVRHGQATAVHVQLLRDDATLCVTITDDGAGFDPDQARTGVGLGSMRERAVELGGSLAVSARPGHGTTITAALPDRQESHP